MADAADSSGAGRARLEFGLAAVLGLLACLLACSPAAMATETLRVAAASDLRTVWLALQAEFGQQSKVKLSASFAASGKLSQQIEQGAPFDVFMSADQAFVERLQAGGHTQGAAVRYTRGQLGLWLRDDSPVQSLEQLSERLSGKLVLANPRHAPYGMRAREVLQASGQWQALEPRLVMGENVAQAAQLALSGQAEAGLIAWSLRKEIPFGRWQPIDPGLHQPLWQVGVALNTQQQQAAQQWLAFLLSAPAQAIFQRHGFLPLEPEPAAATE